MRRDTGLAGPHRRVLRWRCAPREWRPVHSRLVSWIVRALATLVAGALACAAVGIGYEQVARRHIETAWSAPPGGRLECAGTKGPTVLFFASNSVPAIGPWLAGVEPNVEEFATVCRRIGVRDIDWRPPTGERFVAELHDVLVSADAGPPYVLVGWSLGGLAARWFDDSYPGEVAGFVFVDSSHPYMQDRPGYVPVRPPIRVPRWEMPLLRETGVLRLAVSDELPDWIYPNVQRSPTVRRNIAAYLVAEQIIGHSRQLDWAPRALGSRPVVVLTRDVDSADEGGRSWLELQKEIAALSGNALHRVVPDAEHAIWRTSGHRGHLAVDAR
jgi:pimeloyl-ACP methyl ester carboxylesterase